MAKRQHAFVRIAVLVAVALAVLVLDQVSKAFMRSYLAAGTGAGARGVPAPLRVDDGESSPQSRTVSPSENKRPSGQ